MSFLGLKAQIEKSKREASAKQKEVNEKKLPAHLLHQPSKDKRSTKAKGSRATSSWSSTPSSELDTIRANLERKAAIYDKLQRGRFGAVGLADDGLIDWDRKAEEHISDESEDEAPPQPLGADDPEIEYVDELGRTRRAPLSEVPRELVPKEHGGKAESEEEAEDTAIYGQATSFPVYQPEARSKSQPPAHFNADWEVRHRGAGFYKFSKDEDKRKAEMEELSRLRNETQAKRGGESGSQKRSRLLQQRHELVNLKRLEKMGEQGVQRRKEAIAQSRLDGLLI